MPPWKKKVPSIRDIYNDYNDLYQRSGDHMGADNPSDGQNIDFAAILDDFPPEFVMSTFSEADHEATPDEVDHEADQEAHHEATLTPKGQNKANMFFNLSSQKITIYYDNI